MIRKVWKAILPLLFIFLGMTVAKKLFSSRPQPPRQERAHVSPQVEAFEVHAKQSTMEISAMGVVIPGQSLAIQTEIPGRIVEMNENLVPGGRVEKGQVLVRLDDREYRLAVKQQAAAVEQARVQLKIERSRGAIAKREWKLVRPGQDGAGEGNELALRRPHLRSAQATLKAAQSALERARIAVERTTIKAPFNAVIQEEKAEIGQLVGPGAPVAMMVGTDFMWVRVSVPTHTIKNIQLPKEDEGVKGALVRIHPSGKRHNDQGREGHVVRLLGDLDPRGRMARVLVQVQDPLAAPAPLLLGSHVDVTITGPDFEETVEIPRSVVRDGETIWLYTKSRTLEIVEIEVAWSNADSIYITNTLPEGAQVISSHLGAPVNGMSLRLVGGDTAQSTP